MLECVFVRVLVTWTCLTVSIFWKQWMEARSAGKESRMVVALWCWPHCHIIVFAPYGPPPFNLRSGSSIIVLVFQQKKKPHFSKTGWRPDLVCGASWFTKDTAGFVFDVLRNMHMPCWAMHAASENCNSKTTTRRTRTRMIEGIEVNWVEIS